jgi:hypothetical protein
MLQKLLILTILIITIIEIINASSEFHRGSLIRKNRAKRYEYLQKLMETTTIMFHENNLNNNINDEENPIQRIKEPPGFTCSDKEDESYHEHQDCKKYWHCLYVGTIFQSALERRCPIGTMFHPIYKKCEISTMVILENYLYEFELVEIKF